MPLKNPASCGMNGHMPVANQNREQQRTIRELLRAKSDREIARLLRLDQRRCSGISHRERWSEYELRLLGRMRDEPLAKLLRRSPAAVAELREALGIATFAPLRIRWSPRELDLLGKRPDSQVARMLGRTNDAVQLGIPRYVPLPT